MSGGMMEILHEYLHKLDHDGDTYMVEVLFPAGRAIPEGPHFAVVEHGPDYLVVKRPGRHGDTLHLNPNALLGVGIVLND